MKVFLFTSAVAVAVAFVGIFLVRFESASAQDCFGTVETCGFYQDPTQIQALASGLFADDVTWDWYIAGDDEDVGVVFLEWESDDPNDDNVQEVTLDPDFIHWDNSTCNGPLVSTLSGWLETTGSNGTVVIRGVVHHHSVEVCEQDKTITVVRPMP